SPPPPAPNRHTLPEPACRRPKTPPDDGPAAGCQNCESAPETTRLAGRSRKAGAVSVLSPPNSRSPLGRDREGPGSRFSPTRRLAGDIQRLPPPPPDRGPS